MTSCDPRRASQGQVRFRQRTPAALKSGLPNFTRSGWPMQAGHREQESGCGRHLLVP